MYLNIVAENIVSEQNASNLYKVNDLIHNNGLQSPATTPYIPSIQILYLSLIRSMT